MADRKRDKPRKLRRENKPTEVISSEEALRRMEALGMDEDGNTPPPEVEQALTDRKAMFRAMSPLNIRRAGIPSEVARQAVVQFVLVGHAAGGEQAGQQRVHAGLLQRPGGAGGNVSLDDLHSLSSAAARVGARRPAVARCHRRWPGRWIQVREPRSPHSVSVTGRPWSRASPRRAPARAAPSCGRISPTRQGSFRRPASRNRWSLISSAGRRRASACC